MQPNEAPDWVKTAKVGDKVVLIPGAILPHVQQRARRECVFLPVGGKVYTIRTIEPRPSQPTQIFFRFEELRNLPVADGHEPRFWSNWFRPVTMRPTDISVFTELLNTVPAAGDQAPMKAPV